MHARDAKNDNGNDEQANANANANLLLSRQPACDSNPVLYAHMNRVAI